MLPASKISDLWLVKESRQILQEYGARILFLCNDSIGPILSCLVSALIGLVGIATCFRLCHSLQASRISHCLRKRPTDCRGDNGLSHHANFPSSRKGSSGKRQVLPDAALEVEAPISMLPASFSVTLGSGSWTAESLGRHTLAKKTPR